MIHRRGVLGALALAPLSGCVGLPTTGSRIGLTGSLEQGSLVICRAPPGSTAELNGNALNVSSDGVFTFGFEFEQTAPAKLGVAFPDGAIEMRDVVPVARHYEIQSITGLPEEMVTPPPEAEERMKQEHARVALARERDTDGLGFEQPFDWPAAGVISGVFGSQRVLNGEPKAPHFGVDIAAPVGTPIHAPADGIVSDGGDYYLEGGFTMLDHGHGVSTCYLHQSKRLVNIGDSVKQGDVIGLVGQTGRATGPHVHWGMNWFQMRLDPSRSARMSAPPTLSVTP
jgi:murein DD-endopeptidase MepM/ murein hydrolase activator NlpD